ncbi:MAG: hypothetical protein NTZ55_01685 [Candidatus Roizmanbacteria bacterium]|nr:hypothetical protein [Candidatus Roizmanbacteria bacterium]
MNISEKIQSGEKRPYGFPKPTILLDSQSAPKLIGDEIEQQYYRLAVAMGSPNDIALVNYPINQGYLDYTQKTLGIPLPQIIPIENKGKGTLTRDILDQPEVVAHLQELVGQGYKMQFFNFLEDEVALAQQFNENPTYAANLGEYLKLGTKTGFREFCIKHGIPMPQGAVCHTTEEMEQAITEIGGDFFIKSDEGTGGAELGSNVDISYAEYLAADKPNYLKEKMAQLVPAEWPFDVQKKLENVMEGSLHIFLNDDGTAFIDPVVFGQFAHEGSYKGGHFPNRLPHGFNEKMMQIAQKVTGALAEEGATGMHCMDCLFNPQTQEISFIEDNTRPGALDFIHHFVLKIADTNKIKNPHWYHYQLPIKEIAGRAVPFEEVQAILGDQLVPGDSFVAISNPNVLSFGYDLHLTGISGGENGSSDGALVAYQNAVEKLKNHFGYLGNIPIPPYKA